MTDSSYLLDSNIISEVIKADPDFEVIKKLAEHSSDCCISIFTFQELLFGAERLPESRRKNELLNYINEDVYENFPVVNYSEKAARINAGIRSFSEKKGLNLSYSDTQIASTAISEGLILVTRNTRHFEPLCEEYALKLENWFVQ